MELLYMSDKVPYIL